MKTYNNLYKNITNEKTINDCILTAAKGKQKKAPVKRVLENRETYALKIKELLEEESYNFRAYEMIEINEGTKEKARSIVSPSFFPDQIIHHLIVSQLSPIISKSLYEHAFGSIPERGIHTAKKRLEKWIRSYGNDDFYVFKCDIKHFFDNIDHEVLKEKLKRRITDERFLKLVSDLIDSFEEEPGKGIPKGFSTSPWLANLYLTEMDHFIKEDLRVKHYMRYMDDIVLLGSDKEKLRGQAEALRDFIKNELGLEFKDNWQLYRFVDKFDKNGRDIDFMGFRFFRNKTTLRKKNLRTIRRKANHLAKKEENYTSGSGQGVTAYDATSMLSYLGWTKHADVYNWYQREIKPKVNKRALRKKISKKDKNK